MSQDGADRDGGKPILKVEDGFGLYLGLLDEMAALKAAPARSPFADDGFRAGPEAYTEIVWRPKSEERQQFGEKTEPTEELTVPRCSVEPDAVELVLRHGAAAVGKRLVVIVNGAHSTLVRPEALEPGAESRDVRLLLPFDRDVDGKVHLEIVQEQRLVFSRAYWVADGSLAESAQPTPQIVEFRRFDGKNLHFGIKRADGAEPQLPLRFSFDGEERWGTAEIDVGALKAESIQNPYRLSVAELVAPSRLHDVVILGEGPADKIRKGVFSLISVGDDHFWLSRPAKTPEGASVTVVRDDARRGGVSVALSDGAGREATGRAAADPADFRFRKGDNTFSFALPGPLEDFRALHVRDEAGAPLFDVAL